MSAGTRQTQQSAAFCEFLLIFIPVLIYFLTVSIADLRTALH